MKTTKEISSPRELLVLLCIYVIGFILLAINPYDRADWALEKYLSSGTADRRNGDLPVLQVHPSFLLHDLFLPILQSWGGHFTYAEAAPFNWLRDHFHLARNHYDRVAHFMLGFLLAIPIKEIMMQFVNASRRWLNFLTVAVVLAIGAFYELIEWWVAVLATPNLGDKFLGTQGDIWDTQWDMFLAMAGAVITLLLFGKLHERQLGIRR